MLPKTDTQDSIRPSAPGGALVTLILRPEQKSFLRVAERPTARAPLRDECAQNVLQNAAVPEVISFTRRVNTHRGVKLDGRLARR